MDNNRQNEYSKQSSSPAKKQLGQQTPQQSMPSFVQSNVSTSLSARDIISSNAQKSSFPPREPPDALCPAVRRMGYSSKSQEVIGEGAFSKVYRARSIHVPNKDIAVKIVRVDDPMKRELKGSAFIRDNDSPCDHNFVCL